MSIGNKVNLKKCKIKNSLIMDNCMIDGNISLIDSIIDQNSEITTDVKINEIKLLLGQFSKIQI